MSQQNMIEVKDLVKVYPGGTRAVDGIDFAVAQGEFFGRYLQKVCKQSGGVPSL